MLTGVKRSFWGYVKAAFNARPIGMFVPPNWVGLAGFAMLGLLNPGFWLLGAGAELAYLFGLSTSRRFQRLVDGSAIQREREARREQVDRLVMQLDPEDRDLQRQIAFTETYQDRPKDMLYRIYVKHLPLR